MCSNSSRPNRALQGQPEQGYSVRPFIRLRSLAIAFSCAKMTKINAEMNHAAWFPAARRSGMYFLVCSINPMLLTRQNPQYLLLYEAITSHPHSQPALFTLNHVGVIQ